MQKDADVIQAKDRYEQDCLKIKGYLAQGHMVMGQEERKNKAKLEKTQIQLSATSNEYEGLVRTLEDTTARWNKEWKVACDVSRVDFSRHFSCILLRSNRNSKIWKKSAWTS